MADERKKVTLTIDGIQVEAYEGEMVLEAARRAGIDIPTLCYHPAIGPIGSCRVCVCLLYTSVLIYPDGVFYQKVKPEDTKEIVEEHIVKGRPCLLYTSRCV